MCWFIKENIRNDMMTYHGSKWSKVSMLKLPGEEIVMPISDMTPGPSAMNTFCNESEHLPVCRNVQSCHARYAREQDISRNGWPAL